ncbi:pentapeptide repeat-containing protein [Microbispora rosea]|uniref:pentapeptide repeat-containing protein n=1 Tax=Microbispora rosea TaxID=58117 RepID=UPI0034435C2F
MLLTAITLIRAIPLKDLLARITSIDALWLSGMGAAISATASLVIIFKNRRPATADRKPLKTLPGWMVALGLLLICASMWISTAILLGIADVVTNNTVELAKLRSEAIRTGLTVGAGTGGAVALLLSIRRQWLSERAQKHQEEVSAVTELYAKAVEQLGSDSAPVRLAALYALERLADDHVSQRQTIVNVLCAYLRMPYQSPMSPEDIDEDPDALASALEAHRAGRQELEVRQTAQRILARHLGHVDAGDALRWNNVDLDLSHATLISADFRGCRIRKADFQYAEFHGATLFNGAQFTGTAHFSDAKFNVTANFEGVRFDGDARFDDATFYHETNFSQSRFAGLANFLLSKFHDETFLEDIVVTGEFWLHEASAFDNMHFSRAQFCQIADFSRSVFHEELWLDATTFMGPTYFLDARARLATLDEATFAELSSFKGSTFVEISFNKTQFHGPARLDGIRYNSIHTSGCRLYGPQSAHSVPRKLKLSTLAHRAYSHLVSSDTNSSAPPAEPGPEDSPMV